MLDLMIEEVERELMVAKYVSLFVKRSSQHIIQTIRSYYTILCLNSLISRIKLRRSRVHLGILLTAV